MVAEKSTTISADDEPKLSLKSPVDEIWDLSSCSRQAEEEYRSEKFSAK